MRGNLNVNLRTERQQRRRNYREGVRYYLGDHDDALETEDDEHDDNTIINMTAIVVDRTSTFLFPSVPVIELDPASIEDTPEEIWVQDFIEENGGLATLIKWAERGCLSGHTFVRMKANKPFPIMSVLDPTSVTVYWMVDDVAAVVWYEMRYAVGNQPYIQDFVNRGDGNWDIITYRGLGGRPQEAGLFSTLWGEADTSAVNLDNLDFGDGMYEVVSTEKHRGSVPPIIETPHLPHPDSRYGLGEFTQKQLQDAINYVASNWQRLTRENSDPVDFIAGADVEEVEQNGNIVSTPNAAARVTRLEVKGDMAGIGTQLQTLIAHFLAVARVVVLKGEAKDLQRVTNASVRTLFLDMLSKNNILMSSYGRSLKRIVQLALEMGFALQEVKVNPATFKPKIIFPTPLPTDQLELATIAQMMTAIGAMSKRTAATRADLDWASESAAMTTEFDQDFEKQAKLKTLDKPENPV